MVQAMYLLLVEFQVGLCYLFYCVTLSVLANAAITAGGVVGGLQSLGRVWRVDASSVQVCSFCEIRRWQRAGRRCTCCWWSSRWAYTAGCVQLSCVSRSLSASPSPAMLCRASEIRAHPALQCMLAFGCSPQ
jgi:hypothetical protein